MAKRISAQYASLIATLILLVSTIVNVGAQSPATIGGRTLQLTVASGTFPFASSGGYRFVASGVDAAYAIVPISGNVVPSTGTYTYSKTGANTASLSMVDSGSGGLTVSCTFSTPNSGGYTLTSTAYQGGNQSGYFVLYDGVSPATIAGVTVKVVVTSGTAPFASWGSYQFLPTTSGTYNLIFENGLSSSGTYSYSKNSAYNGAFSFNDSLIGQGLTSQLSFDTPTTGTVFLRKSGSSGYQTGVFTMTTPGFPPSITTQPSSQSVNVGAGVTFTVSASGTAPLAYQWRKNELNIAGAISATLTLNNVQKTDAGQYSVAVNNTSGTVVSLAATLIVDIPLKSPVIEAQPQDQTTTVGGSATFFVMATGTAPLSYQWRKNEIDITDAHFATYTIDNAQVSDAGSYSVRVNNSAGSITSKLAMLQITPIAIERPIFETLIWSKTTGFSTAILGQPQVSYRMQWSGDLLNWFDLTNFIASGVLTRIADQGALTATTRFYRVVVPGVSNVPPDTDALSGMVLIPAGSFKMGTDSSTDARPKHVVKVGAFYMGEHEVTKVLWDKVYS